MNKITLAVKLASEIPLDRHRLVAICTDKQDRILSIGQNSFTKTHPKQVFWAKKVKQPCKIFLHAEIDAIIKLNNQAYNIYVARVNRKGIALFAKPCPICLEAIKDVGIENIYYTLTSLKEEICWDSLTV